MAILANGCSADGREDDATAAAPTSAAPAVAPTVTIAKGSSAQGKAGCTDQSCAQIVVSTQGLPPSVSCRVSRAFPDTSGFVTWKQDGNETYQTPNYYGYPNGWVVVTCGSATSTKFNWS